MPLERVNRQSFGECSEQLTHPSTATRILAVELFFDGYLTSLNARINNHEIARRLQRFMTYLSSDYSI